MKKWKHIKKLSNRLAQALRISEGEFWVWYILLILKGDYSQQDICDMWSLPKQTVNTIIRNLLKKDLLNLKLIQQIVIEKLFI